MAYRSTDNWVLSQSRYQLGMKYFGDCPFPVLRHGFSMKIVFFFFFLRGVVILRVIVLGMRIRNEKKPLTNYLAGDDRYGYYKLSSLLLLHPMFKSALYIYIYTPY